MKGMEFPEPVISQALEPKSKADQDKLAIALAKLAEEDPTFRWSTDPETGQTVVSGMGELHLDIQVDRLKREFGVEATVGAPQVAYRVYDEFTDKVTKDRHGNLYVCIDLPDNETMDIYLFSFGNSVEVIEPEYIRQRMKEKLLLMLQKYET